MSEREAASGILGTGESVVEPVSSSAVNRVPTQDDVHAADLAGADAVSTNDSVSARDAASNNGAAPNDAAPANEPPSVHDDAPTNLTASSDDAAPSGDPASSGDTAPSDDTVPADDPEQDAQDSTLTERSAAPQDHTDEPGTEATDAADHDAVTGDEAADDAAEAGASTPRPARTSAGLRSRQPRRPATPVAVRPVKAPLSGLRQKIESTAALRESLDAKEAEAQDLRASIEQLRQELDNERHPDQLGTAGAATRAHDTFGAIPAASASSEGTTLRSGTAAGPGSAGTAPDDPFAPTEPGRRRSWWLLVAIALLVAILLLFLASRCSSDSSSSTAGNPTGTSASASAPSAGSANTSAGPGSTATGGVSGKPAAGTPSPMAWAGGSVLVPPGMPTTGPGLSTPGTHLEVAIDSDGSSLDVYETLVLSAPRNEPLELTIPSLPSGVLPSVANLQIQLDGAVATVSGDTSSGFSAAPAAGTSYTKAVLRYKLAAAVVRVTPAKANRATVLALPLTATYSQSANVPVTLRSTDRQIIGVSCPTAATLAEQICGSRGADGAWTATMPASAARPVISMLADVK